MRTGRDAIFPVVLMAAVSAVAITAHAGSAPPRVNLLDNMDFEAGGVGRPPPGWGDTLGVTSADRPQDGAKSLVLRNDAPRFTAFSKVLNARPYLGKYIRFRAAVRSDAAAGAGLWLRIDDKSGAMFLDNMSDRPVRSSDWTWAEINVVVPPDATSIVLGGIIHGAGTAGFDTASLDVLPEPANPITPEARAYLDRALDVLQTRHLNTNRVDWRSVRHNADALAAYAQTPAQTYPAIRFAVGKLGQRHTFFLPPRTDMQALAAGPSPTAPEAKRLGERVVKLTMPGTAEPVGGQYQQRLRAAIEQHQRGGACGWIIDLRGNGGGNTWPMVNGLRALLGPPPWGGFRDAEGRLQVWTLHGDLVAPVPVNAFPSPGVAFDALPPVAVLMGPGTGSSGEVTALFLAGRKNSRSFGAPTAGLTTANVTVPLSDGATLLVTTAYELDRIGEVVEGPLQPEQPTPLAQSEAAALAWLASKGCV